MPLVQFTLSSTRFIKELKGRATSFGKGGVAYRIRVPEDLKWWYWLEFGTAGRQDSDAPLKSAHSDTYPIDPKHNPAHALAWPEEGGMRFAFHVDHPGIRPRLIYRGVRKEILEYAVHCIGKGLLTDGVRLSSIAMCLHDEVMPYAVEMMGKQLDKQAPGTRVQGSATAGQRFRSGSGKQRT